MRELRRFEAEGFRVVTADLAEGPVRAGLLPDPSAVARAGVPIHANLYRAAARVELEGLGSLLLKVHRPRGLADRLRAAVRGSRARAEWDAARYLCGAGIPTPEPLVVAERRRGLALEQAASGTRFLPARETFEPALRAQPAAKAHALLARTARWIRALHDRGVSHRDLKAANILLSHDGPTLIDLVGVRIGRSVPFRLRCRELARLNASFLGSPHVSRTVRLRFLHTYLAAGPRLGNEWKLWWKAILQATEAKVLKNRKAGRPLA